MPWCATIDYSDNYWAVRVCYRVEFDQGCCSFLSAVFRIFFGQSFFSIYSHFSPPQLARAVWWYYFSKLIEFMDTVNFILLLMLFNQVNSCCCFRASFSSFCARRTTRSPSSMSTTTQPCSRSGGLESAG